MPSPIPAPASEPELPMAGPPKLKISRPIRILAIVSALAIVAAAAGIAAGIFSMRNFFLQAIDPKFMRETATFITGFAEPVPEPGFNPIMAVHLPAAVIFLENPKDKTEVSFWRYQGKDLDAVQELDRAYDMGILMPTNSAKFQSITSKGKKEINGKTITYLQGPLKDQRGNTFEGLIACTIEGDKIVMLQAMQPSDRPFHSDRALAWLARPL